MLARYPDLRIDLDVEHARIDPLDRRYDIVFTAFDDERPDSGRVAHRIFSLPRGVFAAPGLMERTHSVARPEDLADVPAIASSGDAEWQFTGPEGSHAVPIRPRMRSANAEVRRMAAVEGLGVCRVVKTFCREAVAQRRLVELLPGYTCSALRIYTLLPARRLMPPKVRLFLDLLAATGLTLERGER
jgi:DNA-binding transcriptional LysR family regulator